MDQIDKELSLPLSERVQLCTERHLDAICRHSFVRELHDTTLPLVPFQRWAAAITPTVTLFTEALEANIKRAHLAGLSESIFLSKQLAEEKELLFRKNPFDDRLGTHKLHGRLKGLWAFWIGGKYRIIFEFAKKNIIWFHSVGDHSMYYQK